MCSVLGRRGDRGDGKLSAVSNRPKTSCSLKMYGRRYRSFASRQIRLSEGILSTVGSIRDSTLESSLPAWWQSNACCGVDRVFVHARISSVSGWPDKIRPALKEPVQSKKTLRLRVVAVTHGMHEAHVLAHRRAEKTAEARKRA